MPHLAPLSWALAPIIFWFILLTLASTLWWSQSIKFPSQDIISSQDSFSSWNWKLW